MEYEIVCKTGKVEVIEQFIRDLREELAEKPLLVKDYNAINQAAEELAVTLGRPVCAHTVFSQREEYLVKISKLPPIRYAKVWGDAVITDIVIIN